MTRTPSMRARAEIRASVMPSTKYSGSSEKLESGSTTNEGSGAAIGDAVAATAACGARARQAKRPAPRSTMARAATAKRA
jgi:hypothetical protein